jgi:hypothetical protein
MRHQTIPMRHQTIPMPHAQRSAKGLEKSALSEQNIKTENRVTVL